MRTAIVGHRSWLASPLAIKLRENGAEFVQYISKDYAPTYDFSACDAVFLIAGRARPTELDCTREKQLVADIMTNPRPPKRLVYISSLAVERELSPYSQMKMTCEQLVLSQPWGYVVRPPVIFGEGQDINSDMLIPSIARAAMGVGELAFKQPFRPFYLMHVDDVANGISALGRASLFVGKHVRVLNLRSNVVTPMELIAECAPGTPFRVLPGWERYGNMPIRMPDGPDSFSFEWNFSPFRVRDVIRGYQPSARAGETASADGR